MDQKAPHVVNTTFADIHCSQSILIILKKHLEKVQLELNISNEHTAKLDLKGGEIQTVSTVTGVPSSLISLGLLYTLEISSGWFCFVAQSSLLF